MQTSVGQMAEALEGLLADDTMRKHCDPYTNAEASAAIPFGRMIARDAEGQAKLLAAMDDAMGGISVFGHSFGKPDELDTDGLQPDCVFDALQKGRIYVLPTADVAIDDKVYVHMVPGDVPADEPAGQFGPAPRKNALVYADKTFTAANTDIATINAHGFQTGDGPFRLTTTTTLPAGLSLATDYWVIVISANTFYFASSFANALAGTRVDVTDAGTGTHTLADVAGTERVASLNISKFARWRKGADISEGEFAVLEIDMTKAALALIS